MKRIPIAALLALLILAASPRAQAAPTMEEALRPLETAPLQDYGFVRSMRTWAEHELLAMRGKRTFDGEKPLAAVLRLAADPAYAADAPLFKVERPELVDVLGGKTISARDFYEAMEGEALRALVEKDPEGLTPPLTEINRRVEALMDLERTVAILPREDEWLSPPQAREQGAPLDAADVRILAAWEALLEAVSSDAPEEAAPAAEELHDAILEAAKARGIPMPKLALDAFNTRYRPFAKAKSFYLLAALAYLAALVLRPPAGTEAGRRRRRLMRALAVGGFGLLALGFAEHGLGIGVRWALAGRAPLANMYESFIFAVAGMVLAALIVEATQRPLLAGLGAGALGFVLMVLSDLLPIFDSKIGPLMPALQSSWLTYHVVVIMLSYSAFLLSFFLSVAYLALDLATRGGRRPAGRLLGRLPSLEALDVLNYRVVALGFLLLTLGIIFGAVWAETAWGRPWGFDPKETWSLITWLVYAGFLHARYLAGWRGRRSAVFALAGFACVVFTYLGVNYWLPGLHSYV